MADNNPGGTPNNNEPGGTPGDGSGQPELTYDKWLEGQDEATQGMLSGHTAGLKNALKAEREQRGQLQKTLKDVTKQLGEDTDARETLQGVTDKLDVYEQQMAFYETATAAGVGNLKLAWIAAQESGAIDRRGNVNLETLKAEFPEIFKTSQPVPPGNPGAGAGNGTPGTTSMNNYIRKMSGR